MLLSVIIPYYNTDAWIGKLLDSLLDQDIDASDYEIIVVDDASEQEPVVLMEYVNRYPQIHYHRVPHGGMSLARNYGMSVATGEWIYFCDSDDFLQPQVLGGIIRAAQERDLELIVAKYVEIGDNDPIPLPRRNFDNLSRTMTGLEYYAFPPILFSWGMWCCLIKRSLLEASGVLFEEIYYVEDRLFKIKLLQNVSRCAIIDVDLYYYVQHGASFFHKNRKQHNPECIEAFFQYMDRVIELTKKPEVPPRYAEAIYNRLYGVTPFYILSNAFLYSPLQVNVSSMERLEAMGFYPVPLRAGDTRHIKTIKRLMNRRRLWLLLYRIVHLLPDRFIYKHFNV